MFKQTATKANTPKLKVCHQSVQGHKEVTYNILRPLSDALQTQNQVSIQVGFLGCWVACCCACVHILRGAWLTATAINSAFTASSKYSTPPLDLYTSYVFRPLVCHSILKIIVIFVPFSHFPIIARICAQAFFTQNTRILFFGEKTAGSKMVCLPPCYVLLLILCVL